MTRVRRSGRAELDLVEIWCHVARDNPESADHLLHRIDDVCRTLAEKPRMGRKRDELSPSLRSFPVVDYLIFYRPTEDGILVVRVLSGYRDIGALFRKATTGRTEFSV